MKWFTTAACVALSVAFFAGCKKEDDAKSGPTTTTAGKPSGDLQILVWSEYIPKEVIEGFEKETGVDVKMKEYGSNEEMLNLLPGEKYDIVQPSEYTVEYMISKGMLQPLDKGKIAHFKNLMPRFTNMKHDPDNKYSVPYMAGTVGIVYDSTKVTTPIKGFADVFAPANKGKLLVLNDSREIMSWALSSLGKDLNDFSDANLQAGKEQLRKWVPLVEIFDSDSPKDKLLAGDASIGIVWNGEGALIVGEDAKRWKWTLPAEGAHMFVDSFCIPKMSRNPEAAHAFINYILRPEVNVLIHNDFPYLNVNAEGRKLLTTEQLENVASFPTEDALDKMALFHSIPDETTAKIEGILSELKK